ncbi:MAG TPA: DUF72 domain-containing protein [Bdellovibrionales bacterium]|nr:DUF72 domain-containing protein [Bdellovibrionales bacterium]
MSIQIGISGWQYREFRGIFYPKGVKPAEMLAYYARHFSAVELNASFYRFLADSSYDKWRDETPEGFVIAVKANRYFTHFHRLSDPKELWKGFLAQTRRLGHKLGPILFQTHPSMKADLARLRLFLRHIGRGHDFVFEFRHPSWFQEPVYELLHSFGAAFCVYDLRASHSPVLTTSNTAYVRLHGPTEEPYVGSYSDRQLEQWARQARAWDAEGRDVYIFFDNTMNGDAIINARDLVAKIWPKTNIGFTINP